MDTKTEQPEKPTFTMKKVESSSVIAHGYDAASSTLAVEFRGGRVYHFADVPQSVADGLDGAQSAGGYFAANIRDKFTGSKQ